MIIWFVNCLQRRLNFNSLQHYHYNDDGDSDDDGDEDDDDELMMVMGFVSPITRVTM